MSRKIPVTALYKHLQTMLDDKWGYIWGTAGKLWTAQLQANPPDDMAAKYGSRWVGHMVTDCSGVMVYIWKQHGLSIAHGSNSIARKHCGKLVTYPQPGYAAFKWREDDPAKYPDGRGDFYHIGIVGADGQTVYESQGTIQGFTTTPASRWDFFAPFNDVDYNAGSSDGEGTVMYKATVTTESGSLNVRSGPGIDPATKKLYPRTGSIPRGEVVDVVSEHDSAPDKDGNVTRWAFILDDGISGYVSSEYLTPVSAPDAGDDSLPAQGAEAEHGEKKTILRCTENNVTIALVGEWEIIGGD